MKITFFHRHRSLGFSIQHVFSTIIENIKQVDKNLEIEEIHTPSIGSMPWDMLTNIFYVFRHRNKKGINHISGHIHEVVLGLIGCKTVLTVHDLVFIDNVKNPIKRFYKWLFWLYFPIKFSDKVICISEKTKKNILNHIKTSKLEVIHNPLDPAFNYVPKEFNSQNPIILHIGTGWNKNLKRTVAALEGVPCHLRIIGKLNQEQIEILNFHKLKYSNATNLSDAEIIKEYIDCDIVNFPSEYEGFGMPIIEGQKTGRVVLTSAIEPLIEIARDSVHYVNPLDILSIKEGYTKLITDDDYRNSIIKKGLENTKRFQVENISQKYLDIYKKVLN